ncbi:MAG: hypothetical protein ACQEUT_10445 [Bacillota bacterium]
MRRLRVYSTGVLGLQPNATTVTVNLYELLFYRRSLGRGLELVILYQSSEGICFNRGQ